MIKVIDSPSSSRPLFVLETDSTSYAMDVLETGHLRHLHYGRKLHLDCWRDADGLRMPAAFGPGNAIAYDADHPALSMEDVLLEVSTKGTGDTRDPLVELTFSDGSTTADFLFDSYAVLESEPEIQNDPLLRLPHSQGCCEILHIRLKERNHPVQLDLLWCVYPDTNVITRQILVHNLGEEPVSVQRLLSAQLDFPDTGYTFSSFHGHWAREMEKTDTPVSPARLVSTSSTGTSSSRANPFVMLSRPWATEDTGEVYGINLVYSGSHYTSVQQSNLGKTRLVTGLDPAGFDFSLAAHCVLSSPEAVLTWSNAGYNGMSHNMHAFVRRHIVRGPWKDRLRPVLLNSWEACYFKISERKLLSLAAAGKKAGIELFVLDDGWFKGRNDDTQSLGDWTPDLKKLPGGLKRLAERITAMGLQFGIWVEPEMVNVNSDLYRAHPDWALQIPGQAQSEGRSQRILDLSRQDVQDWLIETMSEVFSSADISYVKWDMNRIFSDVFSAVTRQSEILYRYQCGFYRCMEELTARFPHILFEGCASGGNRFDLGMLCFFPQIWASDDTDAYQRARIQNGYSYGYPLNCVSAHVSDCPNHQTLRNTPLSSRFNVAAFGSFGYELNFCDLNKEELEAVQAQIELYKKWRPVLQTGTFWRGANFANSHFTEWTCVSEDQKAAVGLFMQDLAQPNAGSHIYHAKGLVPDVRYRFVNLPAKADIRDFGSLVNMLSPVHLRPGSLVHDLAARFVKLDGEVEDRILYGDSLENGIALKQAFGGTGFNEQVRHFPDFGSRLYFMRQEESSAADQDF